MKKWGLFLGGVATGVVLTFLFAYIVTLAGGKSSPDGVTNFDQPGQIMNEQSVEVFQVIADNAALVHGKDPDSFSDLYLGTVYMLRNYDGKYYYDDEIITLPKGKKFQQTGIYRYDTPKGMSKTVAIIEIK